MSARREPSTPPTIPGYVHTRVLGMGGFADVFLYQQLMPRRSVAVKVLLASSLGDEVRERFRTEADLMAQLSHHPSIVTIYHADVAADGRPYLVMEYCSRPGLGQRYRTERMGVAEVLRIGVRLASAVETAHRAGILHRDIKPANVLITDFGWPALTDFGIAATTGWSSGSAVGMSIPWSPPELLSPDPTGDVRADVYSLAATVYSLLARRSPFEVPDGQNTAADLISRIERAPLAPTGRGDVPDSLHAVLARAMDRSPARRHHSALAFARALQLVEAELMLPLTSLDLPEDIVTEVVGEPGAWPGSADDDPAADDQATRLRPVRSVSPEAPSPGAGQGGGADLAGALGGVAAVPFPGASAGSPGASVPGAEGGEAGTVDGVPEAWRRHAQEVGAARPEVDPARRRGWVPAGVAASLVVVAALTVAGALALGGGQEPVDEPVETGTGVPTPAVVLAVPAPTGLEGTLGEDGSARFTWVNPDPRDGDQYLWGVVTAGGSGPKTVIDETEVTVRPEVPGEQVCLEVSIVRADRRASTQPALGCAG
ncbi:serine/threonine-protein kinase [Actinotalea sp. K2]|uniref:serine/threonine-protein kinase n=1 Tax=Actinotalea sp. K2 TaxID=2939438 RepID=UPI0020176100|nr:serine/threonine-protein kinase [Actinotalea sp. K2]MCL3863204.1 serine/threonine protein kinase [Actinotalea sp. K2]